MSADRNPWLSQPVAPPAPAPGATTTIHLSAPTGPSAPHAGVPAPDLVDQLPMREQQRQADLWCLGSHGGAGESTLSGLVPGWAEAGHAWPRVGVWGRTPVVLMARSDLRGLRAAQAAATQWAAGLTPGVELLGLVVSADSSGRLPQPLRELLRVIAGGVPRVWELPWVESWRTDPAKPANAPRGVRRVVDELTVLLDQSATSAPHRKDLR